MVRFPQNHAIFAAAIQPTVIFRNLLFLFIALAAAGRTAAQEFTNRPASTRQLFDMGWRFVEADVPEAVSPAYDDRRWQPVDLPHDWDIGHAPRADAATTNGGGYYPGGKGTYRKRFATPRGKRVRLCFDGVYQRCRVYVNGHEAGTHAYGYTSFSLDVTRHLRPKGDNVVTTARNMRREVLRHDDTRPVTEALCTWNNDWEIYDPHAEALDVVGYNYMMHRHAADHVRAPQRILWQTESYPRDAFRNWQRTRDFAYIIGDIVWTGLDYLGESGIGRWHYAGESSGEHYQRDQFPYHGAYCGDVDLTGWRKPISHYRDMLWNRDTAPTLYMAVKEPNGYGRKGDIKETQWSVWPTWESWNWPGWEGRTIDVEVCSKAPAVQLYLNGRLVGEKPTTLATEFKAVFPVAYAAGQLRAVAVDAAGRETNSVLLATAGAPAAVRLTADRTAMPANRQSLAYVTAEVIDAEGRVVPNASLPLTVRVDGPARLLAASSADLEDLEPLTSNRATTWARLRRRAQPSETGLRHHFRGFFPRYPRHHPPRTVGARGGGTQLCNSVAKHLP